MYIYSITTNVDKLVEAKWLQWMQQSIIPEVLETGLFMDAKLARVMIEEEMGGVTYSMQCTAATKKDLENYQKNIAPQIHQRTKLKFKDKFVVFETELQVIEKQFAIKN